MNGVPGEGEIDEEEKEPEIEEEEVIEEKSEVIPIRKPRQPSRKEVEEHEVHHIPFREWCPHCVRGRGQNSPHRTKDHSDDDPSMMTVYSLDYMYFTEELALLKEKENLDKKKPGVGPTVLIGVDGKSGCIHAHVVPHKGRDDNWPVNIVINDLYDMGYAGCKVGIKTDQENAIKDLQKGIGEARTAETVPIHSVTGDSKSNGAVENAAKRLAGQVRTMKDSIEAKLGVRIDAYHTLFPWLVEWAAQAINRYSVNKAGRTPHEEAKGRKSHAPIVEFGEKVHFIPARAKNIRQAKTETRFWDGIWLGLRMRSDEAIIGTSKGIVKARAANVRRRTFDERWDSAMINSIQGSPQRPRPDRDDSDIPDDLPDEMADDDDPSEAREEMEPVSESMPTLIPPEETKIRARYVTQAQVDRYGPTPGCPRCHRKGTMPHNEECRERMGKLMTDDEAGKRDLDRDAQRRTRHLERDTERFFEDWDAREREAKRTKEDENRGQATESHQDTDIGNSSGTAASSTDPAPHRGTKRRNPNNDEDVIDNQGDHQMSDQNPGTEKGDDHRKRPNDTLQAEGESVDKKSRSTSTLMPSAPETNIRVTPAGPAGKKRGRGNDTDVGERKTAKRDDSDNAGGTGGADAMALSSSRVDVAEVYSPPRIVTEAAKKGLITGSSMDLTTTDEMDRPWDFTKIHMRNHAIRRIMDEKPAVLMLSPVCTHFSQAMASNWARMTPEQKADKMKVARTHLKFACQLALLQHRAGRYYVLEHPRTATSWAEPCIQELEARTFAKKIIIDQCMYGLVIVDTDKVAKPAKKPTIIMTNCPAMSCTLGLRCDGKHEHCILVGKHRTSKAQVYPEKLCKAIVEGIELQKKWDSNNMCCICAVDDGVPGPGVEEEAD